MRDESHDSGRLGSTVEMPIVSPVWNARTKWLTLFSARSEKRAALLTDAPRKAPPC
jgi:hypothetical protein